MKQFYNNTYMLAIFLLFLFYYVKFSKAKEKEECNIAVDTHNKYVNEEFCEEGGNQCKLITDTRYILYDVNPPEGFNLRRDVFIRMAVFTHKLLHNDKIDVKLVLPPWSYLYHWKEYTKGLLPWSYFFDVDSINKFVPVLEMYEFFKVAETTSSGETSIDRVYFLQNCEEMFKTGKFEEKSQVEPCQTNFLYNYFHYPNLTSSTTKCLSFHGRTSLLKPYVTEPGVRSVLFVHAEIPLHDLYGDSLYWKARMSMRFNSELVEIADKFRETELNSTNQRDNIFIPEDWRQQNHKRGVKGGLYLCAHLRRRDFVRARPKEIPSLEHASRQIIKKLRDLNLQTVFIASDAPNEEIKELKTLLAGYTMKRFQPSAYINKKFGDGGTAIIDQIICSFAQFFIGTYESTFSFRIQEEREIMGFLEWTTFNRFCGDGQETCSKPSIWRIVV